jgi:chromosome segregation ATPase
MDQSLNPLFDEMQTLHSQIKNVTQELQEQETWIKQLRTKGRDLHGKYGNLKEILEEHILTGRDILQIKLEKESDEKGPVDGSDYDTCEAESNYSYKDKKRNGCDYPSTLAAIKSRN